MIYLLVRMLIANLTVWQGIGRAKRRAEPTGTPASL